MSEVHTRCERRTAFRRIGLALFAASLLGSAFACTALRDGGTTTSGGDEPPIRVKNGSFDLELLGVSDGWALENGQSRVWKVPGTRGQADFYVVAAVSDPKLCNTLDTTGADLTVTYSDGTQAQFNVTGNHTKVTVSKDFAPDPSRKARLSYKPGDDAGTGGTGGTPARFIASIVLKDQQQNTKMSCTFSDKTQLHSLIVMDY